MRIAFSIIAMTPLLLSAMGCAEVRAFRKDLGESIATPGTGILPPVPGPVTEINHKLRDLPPPQHPVAVAVYGYGDQTGQFKPATNVQTLSRAVTQGASSILVKALQDAGNGSWFTVIERERLDNLLKERRIIADMRARYLGEQVVDPSALPPLLFAGVLIDGGIISYDSNTKTGGLGANYFGIGGDVSYSEDTVTVYLRGTSVKTGQILISVVSTKKILSYGVKADVFRYLTFNRLLQAEGGFTRNEPGSLAVEQAIEQAVMQFIVEGSARGLWNFRDKGFQSRLIDEYELKYLAEAKAAAPSEGGQTKTAAAKTPAAPAKAAGAPGKPAPTPTSAPAAPQKPQQMSMLLPAPGQQQMLRVGPAAGPQQPANAAAPNNPQRQVLVGGAQTPTPQPAAPQVVVLPRTLEDEVPISPR
jgi:curli production assembly/transport component CsgG